MNQVEQWFSILQRKRLVIADFADKDALAERLHAFVREWNENAHPFHWTKKTVTKIMAKCEIPPAMAACNCSLICGEMYLVERRLTGEVPLESGATCNIGEREHDRLGNRTTH